MKEPKSPSSILWKLFESEAPEKFHVDYKEEPAFLFFPRHHPLARNNRHILYLNGVGVINTFSSGKKNLEHLKEIIEKANLPCRVYRVSKRGRKRGKRVLFAESTVQRVSLKEDGEDVAIKVFNVPFLEVG